MASKGRKRTKIERRHVESPGEPVPAERAFYFYRGIDEPLGITANSFEDFKNKLLLVDPVSVKFHVERQDFQNWLRMLSRDEFAQKVDELRGKGFLPDELKGKVLSSLS